MENFSLYFYSSEWSKKALNEPIKIAKNLNSQITEFSFVPHYCFLKNGLNSSIGEEIFRAKFEQSLNEAQQIFDEKGVREETLIFEDNPFDVIEAYEENNGFDLLVIDSKGKDVTERKIFERMTQKVAANLGCIVLTSNN